MGFYREYKEAKARKKEAKLDDNLNDIAAALEQLRDERIAQLRERMDLKNDEVKLAKLVRDVDSCIESKDKSAARKSLTLLQTAIEDAERVIEVACQKIQVEHDALQKLRDDRNALQDQVQRYQPTVVPKDKENDDKGTLKANAKARAKAQADAEADVANRKRVKELQEDLARREPDQIKQCEAFLDRFHEHPANKAFRGEVNDALSKALVSYSQEQHKQGYSEWMRSDEKKKLQAQEDVLGVDLEWEKNGVAREARKKYAEKYNLTDGELLAVRTYTASNYTFINPSIANQKDKSGESDLLKLLETKTGIDRDEMLRDIESYRQKGWLDDKNRLDFQNVGGDKKGIALDNLSEADRTEVERERVEFAAAAKKYQRKDWMDAMQRPNPSKDKDAKKAGWLNDQGQLDPELGKNDEEKERIRAKAAEYEQLQKEYDEVEKTNLYAEGREHAAMMLEAFKKLPVWKGKLYRGARMNKSRFEREYKVGDEVNLEAFSSMATTEFSARQFADGKSDVPLPEDSTYSVFAEAEVHDGRDLRPLGVLGAAEDEILIMPGTKLRVDQIIEETTGAVGTQPPAATHWRKVILKQV